MTPYYNSFHLNLLIPLINKTKSFPFFSFPRETCACLKDWVYSCGLVSEIKITPWRRFFQISFIHATVFQVQLMNLCFAEFWWLGHAASVCFPS